MGSRHDGRGGRGNRILTDSTRRTGTFLALVRLSLYLTISTETLRTSALYKRLSSPQEVRHVRSPASCPCALADCGFVLLVCAFYKFSFLHAGDDAMLSFWIRAGAVLYCLLLPLGLWLFHADRRFLIAFLVLRILQFVAALVVVLAGVLSTDFVTAILYAFLVFSLPYAALPLPDPAWIAGCICVYSVLLMLPCGLLLRRNQG